MKGTAETVTQEQAIRAALAGVHDPDFMPFGFPWTDGEPEHVARSVALWYHRAIGRWDAQAVIRKFRDTNLKGDR